MPIVLRTQLIEKTLWRKATPLVNMTSGVCTLAELVLLLVLGEIVMILIGLFISLP
ncbi:MAG: hypothetical protein LBJ43_06210 [Propionibacteriaceae bacterium]|jgi:hypothetical protein|nr:hypothetical protein [Propionibacteriaceae bacterium]